MSDATDRTKYLGGSDAAAVLGISPWRTPVELWQEKTGRARKDPVDPMRERILERGKRLEPFIRDMTVQKLRDIGLAVELVASNERYTDREHPFLSCEIDFELMLTGITTIGGEEVRFDSEHINCDAKSVTGFARKKWGEVDTEDVPIEYAAQFMHGLMITGRRYCLVAALRSFDDVDIYWTVRDDETIAVMRAKMMTFWNDHVIADVPPDPIEFSDIKALFPLDNGQAIEATDEIVAKVAELSDVRRRMSVLKEADERLTFEIANYISPNARLTRGGKDLMTWKGQNDTRVSNDLLEAASIFEIGDGGEFVKIDDPKARFSRTKVVRVLRFVKAKK